MSLFAFIVLVAAAIVALVTSPRPWSFVTSILIAGGILLALIVTTGTMVTLH